MSNWRELLVGELGPISRVVAVFQIGPPLARVPFPSFKVKVIESVDGSFLAVLNVAPRGPDGCWDGEAGLGSTIEEALEDVLRRFACVINKQQPLADSDFVWSDPTEF